MSPPPHIDVELLLSQTSWVPAITRQLVRDASLADDVTQATFAAALEHAPKTDNPHRLRAWLFVVARNLARRMQKRELGRRHSEQRAAKSEIASGPDDELDQVHRHKLLAEAVLALAEPYRSAISLRYFSELDYEDIAARQGVTVGTARQRSRGLALLRERLDREFDGDRRARCIALGALPHPTIEPSSVPRATGLSVTARAVLLATAAGVLAVGAWYAFGAANDGESAAPVVGSGSAEPRTDRSDLAIPAAAERRRPIDERSEASGGIPPVRERGTADHAHDLTGIVLDTDGRPLAGATLVVRRDEARSYPIPETKSSNRIVETARVTSDSDGRFACVLPAGRPHDLFASHASGQLAIVSNRYAGEHVVVQLARPSTLRGRVRRVEDGTGVAGVVVRGWTNDEALHPLFDGVTAADGSFQFENLPGASVGLQVVPRDEAHEPWLAVELAGGRTTTLDVPVMRGQCLRGRVVDDETQLPIAGATVGISQRYLRSTTTALDGSYELRGLASDGYHEVRIRAEGYGESIRVPPPFARDGATLDFALARERVVTGRVLGAEGAPIEGAYVAVVGRFRTADGGTKVDSRSTATGSDGRFVVDGLKRGIRHSVFVRAESYGSVAYEIALEDMDQRHVGVRDVVLAPAVVLEGVVIDEFGKPLADCTVNLRGVNADYARFAAAPDGPAGTGHVDNRRGRTDDRGHFAFGDLALGTYRVVASKARVSAEVAITLDERTAASAEPRLVLTTGLGLSGRVIDSDGGNVAGAFVVVRSLADTSEKLVRTAGDGSFHVLGLAPGSYTVEVEPERWTGPEEAHELCFARMEDVRAGDPSLEIVLRRGVPITGRLLDRTGGPVSFARLEARDRDGGRVDRVQARDDGSFALVVGPGVAVDIFVDGRRVGSGPKICARNVTAGASDLLLKLPE